MMRNWYIAGTGKRMEKKVTEVLTKKGVENYCPYTNKEKKISASKITMEQEPLFSSFVFVHIQDDEIAMIKKLPGITDMVYWRASPAMISEEEIKAIRMMENSYNTIQLEKTSVAVTEKVDISEDNLFNRENNILTIRHNGISITLPSMGYRMIAKRDTSNSKQTQAGTIVRDSFLKKLNPLTLFNF